MVFVPDTFMSLTLCRFGFWSWNFPSHFWFRISGFPIAVAFDNHPPPFMVARMIRLTRHGWREMLIGSVVLALMGTGLGIAWWPLGLIVVPVLIFLFAFFRDPERPLPTEQHSLVSPADGLVSDITQIDNDPLLGGPAVRIGIFLSVFNVHVNRAPCDGKVLSVTYKKGKFINAMNHDKASDENESNTILLGDLVDGKPTVVIKQIVGLIARRIVSTKQVGESVARGERIGMIKFGSRTELTIASRLCPAVKVTVGQKVRGAADVIAVLSGVVHGTEKISGDETEPMVGPETPA
jgi:phosphatidylserine decarboxylase